MPLLPEAPSFLRPGTDQPPPHANHREDGGVGGGRRPEGPSPKTPSPPAFSSAGRPRSPPTSQPQQFTSGTGTVLPSLSFLSNGQSTTTGVAAAQARANEDHLASLGVGKIDRPFRTPEPPPSLPSSASGSAVATRGSSPRHFAVTASASEGGESPALIPASRLIPTNFDRATPPPPPTRPPPGRLPTPAQRDDGELLGIEGAFARQRLHNRQTMEDDQRQREEWDREANAQRLRQESFFGSLPGTPPVSSSGPDASNDRFEDADGAGFSHSNDHAGIQESVIPFGRSRSGPMDFRGASVDEHLANQQANDERRDSFFHTAPLTPHRANAASPPPHARSGPGQLPKLQTSLPTVPHFSSSPQRATVTSSEPPQQPSGSSQPSSTSAPKPPHAPSLPALGTPSGSSQPRQQPHAANSSHHRSDSDVYRQYQQETRASAQRDHQQQHYHQRGDSFFGLPAPPLPTSNGPHPSVSHSASSLPAPQSAAVESTLTDTRGRPVPFAGQNSSFGSPAEANGAVEGPASIEYHTKAAQAIQGPPGSQPLPPGAAYVAGPGPAGSSTDLAGVIVRSESPGGAVNWGQGSGSGSGSGSGNNSASASIQSRPVRPGGGAFSTHSGSGSRPPSLYNYHEGSASGGFTSLTPAGAGFGNAYAAAAGSSLQLGPTVQTGPLLDHSHLKPGAKAKLLDYNKTLELYRMNAKKTNDPTVMFEFACFLMDVVKEMGNEDDETLEEPGSKSPGQDEKKDGKLSKPASSRKSSNPTIGGTSVPTMPTTKREHEKAALVAESIALLQKLANRGHVDSQFLLADCYSQAIGTPKGKRDFDKAFPLFVLAAKHGHTEATFRAGQCCENGWGTRKERDKSVTFYRKAAIAQYPPAMYKLGLAEMNGDLGLPKRPKEGVKWLKRAAECADEHNPKPLHELALLHERGIENVLFVDYDYAAELLARASELGYAPSAYKLGECYEYGRMGCPQDSALSIHYYNIAAQKQHREACFALTAWYLVGSPGVLPQSDTEAYLWAKKAAELGLAKACYAVGYFTEVGMGTVRDPRDAVSWYKKAAEQGDRRAIQRLRSGALPSQGPKGTLRRNISHEVEQAKKSKEECIIM